MTSTSPKHPSDAIADDLILAAIDRAERHFGRDASGVPMWEITEHLGIGRRSAAARHVRSRLAALEAMGRLEPSRRNGIPLWVLTGRGRRRLRRAERAGDVPVLPESPQHRQWREAHALAAQEIERMREAVRAAIDEAMRLLDVPTAASSDAWFELSERLRRVIWRLGSASYCLHEWAEPRDEQADIDDRSTPDDPRLAVGELARRFNRRAGRRNTYLWNDHEPWRRRIRVSAAVPSVGLAWASRLQAGVFDDEQTPKRLRCRETAACVFRPLVGSLPPRGPGRG
jgi:hypothetical protein